MSPSSTVAQRNDAVAAAFAEVDTPLDLSRLADRAQLVGRIRALETVVAVQRRLLEGRR